MLFLKDSYQREFSSTIEKIEDNKIILHETCFYAMSGGQPGDIGSIYNKDKEIKILDTIYDENKNINHICENTYDLKKGDEIIGQINWEKRFKHMQMHSALHLLCSLVPYGVTGGQISSVKSRLDFNAENKIDKEELETKINLLINENHKITYEWITNEQLDKQPELVRTMSVKPPKSNNKIRLVKIGNVDLQPCGGTHINTTIEIGKIKIGKIENKGKMNRRVNIFLDE